MLTVTSSAPEGVQQARVMLWLISWIRDQAFVRTLSALKMKWSLVGRMKAAKIRNFD
jgi:hypothetical protein